MLTFKPHLITQKFLKVTNDRTRDVLERRYGLIDDGTIYTLESIGKAYGITRERVRQIENHGIQTIQKSSLYDEYTNLFSELEDIIQRHGIVVEEQYLLEKIELPQKQRNHLLFLLTVGKPFTRVKESFAHKPHWHADPEVAQSVIDSLHDLASSIAVEDLLTESEIFERFKKTLNDIPEEHMHDERMGSWLRISKKLDKNPLGEWGSVESSNVHTKGVRDYAYLTVKRHGSPMHFREVAESIKEIFGYKAHVATTHNELIKDARFVLVGRGLYALQEWGYVPGVVKDVLRAILETNGPLTREEILDTVRKERYVKDNTIMVNLQDATIFKKHSDGRYSLVTV